MVKKELLIDIRKKCWSLPFNESNSLSQVLQTLENTQNVGDDTQVNSGVLISFRATDQLYKMQSKFQQFQQLQDNEKSRHKQFYQTKINQLEEKSKHGDLYIVKLCSFSNSKAITKAISSSLASSFSNQKTKIHSQLFNPFSPFQSAFKFLQNKYLFADTPWFANFPRRYNYMNSLELAHYFFPSYSTQQLDLKPNLIQLSNSDNILFKFNELGDDLDFSKGKLNKLCFGDPDSGKSSAYMTSELKGAFGFGVGIISTVYKQEEADLLIHLAIQNGRGQDLIVLNKDTKWQTNIAESQLKASLSIKNIINLFEVINKAVEGGKAGGGNQDPFWERSNNELQNAIIRLMLICDGKFSISRMIELSNLASNYASNHSSDNTSKLGNVKKTDLLEDGKFETLLVTAKAKLVAPKTKKNRDLKLYTKTLDAGQLADFRSGVDYFKTVFVNIPEKQRDSLLTVYRSILNYCNSGIIRDKLFADITPASPNWFDFESTRAGKIIVLDIPKESTGFEGQYFQIISKIAWQQSMLVTKGGQNNKGSNNRDVYFISDEFQEFASSGDSKFLSANRSYGVHNVLATQNYKGLELVLGKVGTDDLLEKCQTKLFFKTSAIDTIDYAQKLIGEDLHYSSSQSLGGIFSTSTTDNVRSQLLPRHFQALSANIPAHQAQCIIFSQGRIWKQTKKPFLSVIFTKVNRFEVVDIVKVLPEQFKVKNKEVIKVAKIPKNPKVIVDLDEDQASLKLRAKRSTSSDKFSNQSIVKEIKIGLGRSETGKVWVDAIKNSPPEKESKKVQGKIKSEAQKPNKPVDVFLTIKEVTQQFPISRSAYYRLAEIVKFKTIYGKLHKGKPTSLILKSDLEKYFLELQKAKNLETKLFHFER